MELRIILLQSSISWEIAYLIVRLFKRSANHLCCKCLIGKKQLMLNKIIAYHQLGKMTVIEIVWMWSEDYSWEWNIMCELQISWVVFVDSVSYPVLSLKFFFVISYYFLALRLRVSKCSIDSKVLLPLLYPFLKIFFLCLSLT